MLHSELKLLHVIRKVQKHIYKIGTKIKIRLGKIIIVKVIHKHRLIYD
jgi:hypothetical protein